MSSPTVSRKRPPAWQPGTAGSAPGPRTERVAAGRGRAGRYRYDRRSSAWWWSPEMFALQGLEPGTAQPCTEVLLAHLHPDDRAPVVESLAQACTAGDAFTVQGRIVGADGRRRTVVLVGEPELEPTGAVGAVQGLCIEVVAGAPAPVDADRVRALEQEVEQLRTAMASRATIEQAKGILMLLTCCTERVAFDLLAHISSHTHRKVREVAQSIAGSACGLDTLPADVCAIIRDACPPPPTSR